MSDDDTCHYITILKIKKNIWIKITKIRIKLLKTPGNYTKELHQFINVRCSLFISNNYSMQSKFAEISKKINIYIVIYYVYYIPTSKATLLCISHIYLYSINFLIQHVGGTITSLIRWKIGQFVGENNIGRFRCFSC